jgi:hypothetical protein
MAYSIKNVLRVGAIAVTIALPYSANAQGSDAVRAKCIADATAAYPDDVRYEHQFARKELYITCMQKAGLNP